MYVATKGGERAIANGHRLLREQRRPRDGTQKITIEQILDQQWLAVSRVMTEGSVYDPELAATAIAQAQGDLVEAVFLVRAYRTTLPRLAESDPISVETMRVGRRVSAAFKDVPGGQILGPTFDYSHRLIDFAEWSNTADADWSNTADADWSNTADADSAAESISGTADRETFISTSDALTTPRVLGVLDQEGLIEETVADSGELHDDLTREPMAFPASRSLRLQALARGDEGFLLGLAYSTQRGYGSTHPFVGEIRVGFVDVELVPDELDFPVAIGEIEVTECEMINQFRGSATAPPQFTRGYGVGFGQCERKAMSMALVDRAMRAEELGEHIGGDAPAQDIEFVLSHADSLEASGFVQHLKLPHYVDFQSELVMLRDLRDEWEKAHQ
jgi:alpha-D-ribose 1-methylphosphonate 5-triphosphate synthase subunit PhnI